MKYRFCLLAGVSLLLQACSLFSGEHGWFRDRADDYRYVEVPAGGASTDVFEEKDLIPPTVLE